MIASDVIVLVMLVGMLAWLVPRIWAERGRGLDTVVMRSIPGLVIAGTVFGALAIAMVVFGGANLTRDPMRLIHTRFGPAHQWAVGLVAIGVGVVVAYPAALLFGKARQLVQQRAVPVRTVATRAPVVAARPPADLAKARRTALDRLAEVATVDALVAIARDFLRDAYDAPSHGTVEFLRQRELRADDWQALLDRIDAARFGGAKADPSELAPTLRSLIG